ncbi:cellulose synthase/poly-beta-1,6-N-acetylglucosamine synthase-like glycosyltransferase [Methylovorus glucosotrophus]|uniref:EpsO n=1 Tax=Methylobacillus sp. (strain 12S) TaxID=94001 RepID=Q83VQ6_METS1|nr:glycosyltransferase family 2 protein [Methylovorus glucosotrophus]KAF0843614.1 cellulose synthase/poly-beta-1,6-N-acetylglucosamine synthase-like glycosyltransferase [Methylovorus glucosotrophus]BAC55143.1 EpsO [Methylobacillus sp. 12S]
MQYIDLLWFVVGLVLFVPTSYFCLQIVMAFFHAPVTAASTTATPSLAILVPAHNESNGIGVTLKSLLAQVDLPASIIVIADNCTDDTADVARQYGVTVIERQDDLKRGKGFALDFGMQYLKSTLQSPEIVMIVDADCWVGPHAIPTLAQTAREHQRPVQALYLMVSPDASALKTRLAEFAWVIKNQVRPLGLRVMQGPCQLMGTGMAFPWAFISNADLANGHLVEDMKLGLDAANDGHAPVFCHEALVKSAFAANEAGADSQRTRWEHGHISMIFNTGLPLVLKGLRTRNAELVAMALDICIPPLALLVMCLSAYILISALLAVFGYAGSLVLGGTMFVFLFLAVMAAWAKFGRHAIPLWMLAYAPLYALRKIPLYLKYLVKRQVEWVRSQRD